MVVVKLRNSEVFFFDIFLYIIVKSGMSQFGVSFRYGSSIGRIRDPSQFLNYKFSCRLLGGHSRTTRVNICLMSLKLKKFCLSL